MDAALQLAIERLGVARVQALDGELQRRVHQIDM